MASKRRGKSSSVPSKAESDSGSEAVDTAATDPVSDSTPDPEKAGRIVEAETEAAALDVAKELIEADATLIVRTIDKRRSYVRGDRGWSSSPRTLGASTFRPYQLAAVIFDRLLEVRVP